MHNMVWCGVEWNRLFEHTLMFTSIVMQKRGLLSGFFSPESPGGREVWIERFIMCKNINDRALPKRHVFFVFYKRGY